MKEFSISPEELRAKQEAAIAERPAIEAKLKLAETAAKEPTFSGWLRRQIHAHPEVSFPRLQEASGLGKIPFLQFLEGQAPISTEQADALCTVLGIVPAGAEKVA
ncbi:MAG: hypothetical protein C0478_08550 [Planctomyces sp.]|nr:hypothetical protein [Planctomyces sp.]